MNQREIELSLQGCLQGMFPSWGGPNQPGSFGSAEELDAATGWHDAGHISACLGEKWGYQQGQDITVLPHAPLWFLSLGSRGRLGGRECSEEHQAVLVFSSFFRVWCIQSLANWAAKRNALGHCVCRGNLSIPVEQAGCRWGHRAQPLGDSMQLLGAWSGTHPQGTTASKSHWDRSPRHQAIQQIWGDAA